MPTNPIVLDYLLKKKQGLTGPAPMALNFPPVGSGPSSFDIGVSNSTAPTSGMMPPVPEAPPPFKLTLDDIKRPTLTEQLLNTAPVEEPTPIIPEIPNAVVAPKPLPKPESTTVEPSPVVGVPTKATEPPTSKRSGSGVLSLLSKALAGYADARNAGIGQKSNFMGGIQDAERQAKVDERAKIEFDRKEGAEKEKDDPNSPYSRALQEVGKKVFPKGDFSKMTGRQLEGTLQPYLKLFDIEKDAQARKDSLEAARLNREEARDIRTGQKNEDRIQGIRKEITGSKSYQGWLDIKNASDNLQNALANPTGKRSLGALYSYVKALDPGSVVREGEISLAGEARSVAERLEGTIRKWATGNVLNPSEIKELADWAREKEQLARKTAVDSNAPAIEQAKRNQFDLGEINKDLFGPQGGGDNSNEIRRKTADGRVIVYDKRTKKPLREEKF